MAGIKSSYRLSLEFKDDDMKVSAQDLPVGGADGHLNPVHPGCVVHALCEKPRVINSIHT